MSIEASHGVAPALPAELADALLRSGYLSPPLQLIERTSNLRSGANASEVLTIRDGNAHLHKVLRKVRVAAREGDRPLAALQYEAVVHREILEPFAVRTARYLGECVDAETGGSCILFEYLDGARQVSKGSAAHEVGMRLAAAWIGDFHRQMQPHADSLTQVNRLDKQHYVTVARRAIEYSRAAHENFPWIPAVCRQFEDLSSELLADAVTVIHGDYYADNVLLLNGAAWPVDWEWCALGPGAVDIASLTNRWSDPITDACLADYAAARWPAGAPEGYHRSVDLARLYLCLRYMSVSAEFTMADQRRWRLTAIRNLSEKLDL